MLLKTETFDVDPGWDGGNSRATDPAPRQIVQNFGFNSSSTNADGSAGEIGDFITPAGEPAFYAKVITHASPRILTGKHAIVMRFLGCALAVCRG